MNLIWYDLIWHLQEMAIVSQTIVTSAICTNFKKAIMMILRNADFLYWSPKIKAKKVHVSPSTPKGILWMHLPKWKGCTKDKWNLGWMECFSCHQINKYNKVASIRKTWSWYIEWYFVWFSSQYIVNFKLISFSIDWFDEKSSWIFH